MSGNMSCSYSCTKGRISFDVQRCLVAHSILSLVRCVGQPVGIDNTSRRKFDKEEYLERARQREQREKEEARKGKDRGPPVQRQPLKHRDYEVDLGSRLGKTQVVTPIAPLNQQVCPEIP